MTEFGWNEPKQARSIQKVQTMLSAAMELAIEQGALDISMTAVAKRAGVPIGTLYQFFPTRTALIGKLFAQAMEPIDASVADALAGGPGALGPRVEAQMLAHLTLVRTQPGLALIWASPDLDPAIRAADDANTKKNAAVLTARLQSAAPPELSETDAASWAADVAASALLVCHLWSSVIRLCARAEEGEAERIIRQYALMISTHGERLLSGQR
ncbi:MAG: TetR/AcrR family transcriptional regulator [Pseudomonadota bacterium]